MERRDFVKSMAGAAVAMGAVNAFAADHKDHMKPVKLTESGFKKSKLMKVAEAASGCLSASKVCIAHCTREFAAGRPMMAACQALTENSIACCSALETVVTMNALPKKEMTAFVKACIGICELCEAECKKHKAKECKDAAKACAACIKACKALIA